MTSFNELVIGSSQGFAFLLKIITEVFQDDVHFQGHGLAMISHKCEPSVSKEFNLFSVVDFYCLCVCHSNSPTVCSALKNGHLLCRIEHFHFLDGILTSLCIFYSLLYTVLSLSWTVCVCGWSLQTILDTILKRPQLLANLQNGPSRKHFIRRCRILIAINAFSELLYSIIRGGGSTDSSKHHNHRHQNHESIGQKFVERVFRIQTYFCRKTAVFGQFPAKVAALL